MEDVLTSSVLGLLKYLPHQLACDLLSALADLPTLRDTPCVCLWPRYPTPSGFRGFDAPKASPDEDMERGDTEPDAVITAGGWLVFVEAKYLSPLDQNYDQLGRQFVIGFRRAKAEGLRFRHLVLTAQTCAPTPGNTDLESGLQRALQANASSLGADASILIRSVPDALRWSNWQAIYDILSDVRDRKGIHGNVRRLLCDVLRLLQFRGLRPYRTKRLLRQMVTWDRHALKDPASILTARYGLPVSATLAVGWRALDRLDLSPLTPLAWQPCRLSPDLGYRLAAELTRFDLESLRNPGWHFAVENRSEP
jgi:hypothetical protein